MKSSSPGPRHVASLLIGVVVGCSGANAAVDDAPSEPVIDAPSTLPSEATAKPQTPPPGQTPQTPAPPPGDGGELEAGAADAGTDGVTGLGVGAPCLLPIQCATGICALAADLTLRCAKL